MGKTRKKKKAVVPQDETLPGVPRPPKTFVMERGRVGRLLNELIIDLRRVMEPNTATRLKPTKRNTLKDFVHVAGPLGVSHFVMISKSSEHVNIKIAKLPRGPTLTFHVEKFCLSREVVSTARRPPPVTDTMFLTPPTLILNNFSSEDKPTGLMATVLQNMFPTLNIQGVRLASLKRCALWSYKKDTGTVEFRHFAIKVVPRGTSRSIRKISQSKIPNLSKYEDISEFVLGGGAGSESEGEEGEGEVTLAQDLPGRGNIKQQQSAVKLYELGPRLSLQLVKIEEGLCNGEVLHHSYIEKSSKEVKLLRKKMKERNQLKLARKREQERNVKRKIQEKETKKQQERIRQGKVPVTEEEDKGAVSEDNDAEWYRKEVGVAPDPDLMISDGTKSTSKIGKKRTFSSRTTQRLQKHSTKSKRYKSTSSNNIKNNKLFSNGKSQPLKKKFTGTVYRKKAKVI